MKQSMNIEILQLGSSLQSVELPNGSTTLELKEHMQMGEEVTLYRRKIELLADSGLEEGDVIIATIPVKGAVDVRCAGVRWQIHKNDADPRPSDFHAHDHERNRVLDLYTGIIYDKSKMKVVSRIKPKHYRQILNKLCSSKEEEMRGKAESALNLSS